MIVMVTENLYDSILQYLKSVGLVLVDEYIPYYICSIGAHIVNILNKECGGCKVTDITCGYYPPPLSISNEKSKVKIKRKPSSFYCRFGNVADCRLHIMMVSPPGYFKSLSQRIFLDAGFGLVSKALKCKREGYVTEAGFIGTIQKTKDGNVQIEYGDAHHYCNGILGFEEFSSVLLTSKQEHSIQFINQLLMVLDNGYVCKRLGAGSLAYNTKVTVWGATQTKRLNLTCGLGRRFLILHLTPTQEIEDEFTKAYDKGEGITPDKKIISSIQSKMSNLICNTVITGIQFTDEYKQFRNDMGLLHYELELFDRLAIGYHLMRYHNGINGILRIDIDDDLGDLMIRAQQMRDDVLVRDPSANNTDAIKEWLGNKKLPITEVAKSLSKALGIDYKTASNCIKGMVNRGELGQEMKKVPGIKKPITLIFNKERSGD